jgi:hypothetical protein
MHNKSRMIFTYSDPTWKTTGILQRKNDFVDIVVDRSFPSPEFTVTF